MKKKGHSANGKRAMLAIAWKTLLAVAVFGLAFGGVGCGKKSKSSGSSSARESSSAESPVETKVCALPGEVKLEMVRIKRESPGFWIGKFEVTQRQWEAVMGNNPSAFKGADLPVEGVSWDDCQDFIKKLNALPEVEVLGWTYRLPTEKEWEYACRAGSTGNYCKLADGTEITESTLGVVAWYDDNCDKTHLVGQKKPNAFGLYDMHGNVWEWCEELYEADGPDRVARGGCWYGTSRHCTAGQRYNFDPAIRGWTLGFRLAASQNVNQ